MWERSVLNTKSYASRLQGKHILFSAANWERDSEAVRGTAAGVLPQAPPVWSSTQCVLVAKEANSVLRYTMPSTASWVRKEAVLLYTAPVSTQLKHSV